MRRVTLPTPPPSLSSTGEGQFLLNALREIETASYVSDPAVIASGFVITGHTETRSLNVATATTADIANVLATLILDLARGGAKKG
jgi:hypothetical protein